MIRKEWQRPAESFGKGFVGQRLAGLLALVAFVPADGDCMVAGLSMMST